MNESKILTYKQAYEQLEPLASSPIEQFKLYLVRQIATSTYRMAKKTCIYDASDRSQDQTLHEVKMLKELKNPHIIKYYDVFLDDNDFIVILEFCEEGDLDYYIKKRKERKEMISQKLVLSWMMQILMALEFIHSKNIIHRLISSHNIYMNHQGDMKLGSFGAAKMLQNTLQKALTVVGSPCNLSPQIVEGKPYDSKIDIWALGCLVFELTTFQHPYQIKNLPQLYEMIVKLPAPDLPIKYSKYLNPIFKKMMKKNPKHRPTAGQLLQEEVFLKLMKEYIKKKKIDSLDLREIVPKQLLIHRKKNPKSILPPLHPQKSTFNETQPLSQKSSYKKLKNSQEQPLSRSREKLTKIKPESQSAATKEKEEKEMKSPPIDKKQSSKKQSPNTNKKEESKAESISRSARQPRNEADMENGNRITKPNYDEGEYISLLCQLKLQLLCKKYEPNMEQIFQQTIEFD